MTSAAISCLQPLITCSSVSCSFLCSSPLSELEDYVDHLQSSASSPGQLSITLRDVEEGAVSLRRIGEALATLKGQWRVRVLD